MTLRMMEGAKCPTKLHRPWQCCYGRRASHQLATQEISSSHLTVSTHAVASFHFPEYLQFRICSTRHGEKESRESPAKAMPNLNPIQLFSRGRPEIRAPELENEASRFTTTLGFWLETCTHKSQTDQSQTESEQQQFLPRASLKSAW